MAVWVPKWFISILRGARLCLPLYLSNVTIRNFLHRCKVTARLFHEKMLQKMGGKKRRGRSATHGTRGTAAGGSQEVQRVGKKLRIVT